MIVASMWGLTAFILRISSTHNQQDSVLELMSSIFALTISPSINAFNYVLLGHLVHYYLPSRSLFGIRAPFLALPFLVLNAAAFVLEVVGATMMDKRNLEWEQMNADHVYMGGLVVQLVVILGFVGVLAGFWREVSSLGRRVIMGAAWRGLVGAMCANLGLILVGVLSSSHLFSS